MARHARAPVLETRSARLKLPTAKKPVFAKIGHGLRLGYRRNQTAGTWVVAVADGKGGNWTKAIGVADDYAEADGREVIDYWQAQDRARKIARAGKDNNGDDGRPVSVGETLDRYEADLGMRGGDVGNVARVRFNLTAGLRDKLVALLTSRELRQWRNALASRMAAATVNRTCSALKAALNLAAQHDERIANQRAWESGLATIPDADRSRNVILGEDTIRAIIAAAYCQSDAFGLLVEVAAVTGARVSQLARLELQDVQGERADPRLMMPSSKKGKGVKKIERRPVPIPPSLAARLRARAGNAADLLLVKPSGEAWRKSDHSRIFARAALAAGQEPGEVTLYALRHSNIVRQILAGVPIRVVAVNHDTSIAMLERTYSRYIADHADSLARAALLETTPPLGDNVVPLRG